MYANGEGALQDLSKAKYWIKKAYEGGNARAEYCHHRGVDFGGK
jgi:TPR repeat protein